MMLALLASLALSVVLDTYNFFDGQPDGTIVITTNNVNKSSNWYDESPRASGGAGYGQWTNKLNEWMEASFVGSEIYVYGTKNSDYGTFILYIDGEFNKIVDARKDGTRVDHLELAKVVLNHGHHTIKILINKSPITIDCFFFKPEGLNRIAWKDLSMGSGWGEDSGDWGSDHTLGNWTRSANAFVEYKFTGYYFMICGTVADNYGKVDVSIDGTKIKTFDCRYVRRNLKTMLFSYFIPQGYHTIRFSLNEGLIGFSGFYVGSYLTVPLPGEDYYTSHPDETILISMNVMNKSSTWKNDGTAGSGQWTQVANEWAEASFVGSTFYIFGCKHSGQGTFNLIIDGNLKQTVDCKKDGGRADHVLLVTLSLLPGYHIIKIVVKENKPISIDGIYFKPEGLKMIPFEKLTMSGWSIDSHPWAGSDYVGYWTKTAGSYVEYTFSGSYFMACGTIDPSYESVDLTIDDVLFETRSCKQVKRDVKAMLFAYELSQGKHKVRYSYKNGLIGFSGFYIGQYYTFHEYSEFSNTGTWYPGDDAFGAKHQWSGNGASSMELLVKCTSVAIKGILDPVHGYMDVSVNNSLRATVNIQHNPRVDGVILFSFVTPLDYYKIKISRSSKNNSPIDIHGIYVLDNLDAGSFNFEVKQTNVQGGQTVSVNVIRSGGSNGPSGVSVSFIDGTAKNNDHYTATNIELEFLGGETSKTVTITTITKVVKMIKQVSFTIKLLNPKHFGILGDLNTTDVIVTYTPLPTQGFTCSNTFTQSPIFSISNQFSSSSNFLKSIYFSNSHLMTESNKFIESSDFSKSGYFEKSKYFSISNDFANTKEFSISGIFEKSNLFSISSDFIKTIDFTASSAFSLSLDYSKSNNFVGSSLFSNSRRFSGSSDFEYSTKFSGSSQFQPTLNFMKSGLFSISKEFSNTIGFSIKADFDPSNKFSQSVQFQSSNVFSRSGMFSFTEIFAETVKFSKSKYFDASEHFSESNQFLPTLVFKESSLFSHSLDFNESIIFSNSHVYSASKNFEKSDVFSFSYEFVITNMFSESSIFIESRIFSQSIQFQPTQAFKKSVVFSESIHFEETDIFSRSNIKTKEKALDTTQLPSDKIMSTNENVGSNSYSSSKELSKSQALSSNQYNSLPTYWNTKNKQLETSQSEIISAITQVHYQDETEKTNEQYHSATLDNVGTESEPKTNDKIENDHDTSIDQRISEADKSSTIHVNSAAISTEFLDKTIEYLKTSSIFVNQEASSDEYLDKKAAFTEYSSHASNIESTETNIAHDASTSQEASKKLDISAEFIKSNAAARSTEKLDDSTNFIKRSELHETEINHRKSNEIEIDIESNTEYETSKNQKITDELENSKNTFLTNTNHETSLESRTKPLDESIEYTRTSTHVKSSENPDETAINQRTSDKAKIDIESNTEYETSRNLKITDELENSKSLFLTNTIIETSLAINTKQLDKSSENPDETAINQRTSDKVKIDIESNTEYETSKNLKITDELENSKNTFLTNTNHETSLESRTKPLDESIEYTRTSTHVKSSENPDETAINQRTSDKAKIDIESNTEYETSRNMKLTDRFNKSTNTDAGSIETPTNQKISEKLDTSNEFLEPSASIRSTEKLDKQTSIVKTNALNATTVISHQNLEKSEKIIKTSTINETLNNQRISKSPSKSKELTKATTKQVKSSLISAEKQKKSSDIIKKETTNEIHISSKTEELVTEQKLSKDKMETNNAIAGSGSEKKNTGMIYGIVFGLIIVIVIIVLLIYIIIFKKRKTYSSSNLDVFDLDECNENNETTMDMLPTISSNNFNDGLMSNEPKVINEPADDSNYEYDYEYEEFFVFEN